MTHLTARTVLRRLARRFLAPKRPPRLDLKSPKDGFVWNPGGSVDAACPACGEAGPKKNFLELHSIVRGAGKVTLADCPKCHTRFLPHYGSPEYVHDETSDYPMRFYVEQGAGIDQLTRPAFALKARGGVERYLEIGGGYGFGIDFAARVFGWNASGIDPSGIARRGLKDLGIRVDSAYLVPGGQNKVGMFDAIVGNEVIEHISDPVHFLETLKDHLSPGGAIYLSTPNAAVLNDRADPMLVAVASPGYHVVIFSGDGLAAAMTRAGFDNVRVETTPSTLFASGTLGGKPLAVDVGIDRSVYRDYLRVRKGLHEPGSTLWMGFAGRLYKELVNDGRLADAEPVFAEIAAALKQQRGIDLTNPRSLIAEAPDADRHLNSGRWPFSLAGMLYLRGIHLINTDWAPEPPFPYFLAALDIGHKIRESLLTWGADDGELHNQLEAAEAALVMCLQRLRER
jgi:SAM-dependent methyltransferase